MYVFPSKYIAAQRETSAMPWRSGYSDTSGPSFFYASAGSYNQLAWFWSLWCRVAEPENLKTVPVPVLTFYLITVPVPAPVPGHAYTYTFTNMYTYIFFLYVFGEPAVHFS
jgi:hypothetical protein